MYRLTHLLADLYVIRPVRNLANDRPISEYTTTAGRYQTFTTFVDHWNQE